MYPPQIKQPHPLGEEFLRARPHFAASCDSGRSVIWLMGGHGSKEVIERLLVFFLRLVERTAHAAQVHLPVWLPRRLIGEMHRGRPLVAKFAKNTHTDQ